MSSSTSAAVLGNGWASQTGPWRASGGHGRRGSHHATPTRMVHPGPPALCSMSAGTTDGDSTPAHHRVMR